MHSCLAVLQLLQSPPKDHCLGSHPSPVSPPRRDPPHRRPRTRQSHHPIDSLSDCCLHCTLHTVVCFTSQFTSSPIRLDRQHLFHQFIRNVLSLHTSHIVRLRSFTSQPSNQPIVTHLHATPKEQCHAAPCCIPQLPLSLKKHPGLAFHPPLSHYPDESDPDPDLFLTHHLSLPHATSSTARCIDMQRCSKTEERWAKIASGTVRLSVSEPLLHATLCPRCFATALPFPYIATCGLF